MKDNNTLPQSYREFFLKHRIRYLDSHSEIESLKTMNILFVTSCSKTKSGNQRAVPKDFYVSKRNMAFYNICEQYNLPYAIQSDMYGLHFANEELDYYDVHPSKLSQEDKKRLGETIRNKCQARGIDCILFCNSSPLMSRPYFEMLTYSGINYYYISDMKLIY